MISSGEEPFRPRIRLSFNIYAQTGFQFDGIPVGPDGDFCTQRLTKDYVLEQTDLKVSSLYISQVKRKCGLDVSDSYNKPKSENVSVPQCPPEKEEAIMSSLRHFGVI